MLPAGPHSTCRFHDLNTTFVTIMAWFLPHSLPKTTHLQSSNLILDKDISRASLPLYASSSSSSIYYLDNQVDAWWRLWKNLFQNSHQRSTSFQNHRQRHVSFLCYPFLPLSRSVFESGNDCSKHILNSDFGGIPSIIVTKEGAPLEQTARKHFLKILKDMPLACLLVQLSLFCTRDNFRDHYRRISSTTITKEGAPALPSLISHHSQDSGQKHAFFISSRLSSMYKIQG